MDTKKLRQKILDLAIRGKLVPQDPNDEPASVLLERIRAEKEQLIKEGKIKRSKKSASTDKSHYENVPFEIPESWEWVTLGEISNYGQCENVNVNVISAEEWILELEDIEKDTGRILQRLSKSDRKVCGTRHKFHINEILYSKLRTYLNKVLVAPSQGYCTSEIIPINCFSSNPQYLCMVLRSNYYLDYTASLGYGVKMPRLGTNDALISCIPLPPLSEQNRIVDEVKKWEKLIDVIELGSNELFVSATHIKSKILDLAISGKLVPQDSNDEPAIELLKRINPNFVPCDNSHYENLPFEVPNNWCWATLGSIGKWQSGATPSRMRKDYYGGEIPWLKTGDLNDGLINNIPEYITQKALDETSVKLNPAGSILIAMYGATIGKIGILTMPATTNQACCACVSHNGVEQMYLFYFLLSHREEFIRQGGGGAQPNISKEKIIETMIPVPPLNEQHRIVQAIDTIFNTLNTITAEL